MEKSDEIRMKQNELFVRPSAPLALAGWLDGCPAAASHCAALQRCVDLIEQLARKRAARSVRASRPLPPPRGPGRPAAQPRGGPSLGAKLEVQKQMQKLNF